MSRFVAVELPGAVATALSEALAPWRQEAAALRWVDAARYHLTVVFCGALGDERLPAAVAAVAGVCAGAHPFELALDGRLGHFAGRVLWAGLESSPPLEGLAAAARTALAGVVELPEPDRRLHPHLTLARAPGQRRKGGATAAGTGAVSATTVLRRVVESGTVPPVRWTVPQLALLRTPPPGPAVGYVREAVTPLRAQDA